MNVLLIEDELFAAEDLRNQLVKLRPDLQVMGPIATVSEAVSWFRNNPEPDLLLCDIHLGDGISFEIFRDHQPRCPVIFTTAYDEYAIRAFQVNSVDYLLKPIRTEKLEKALGKWEQQQPLHSAHDSAKLQALLQKFNTGKKRFLVKQGQLLKTIPTEDVSYFVSEEGVTLLVTEAGKRYALDQTLEQLEQELNPQDFFRLNRKYIANIRAITEVHPYFKGRLIVRLQPGTPDEVVVSSNKTPRFREWLDA